MALEKAWLVATGNANILTGSSIASASDGSVYIADYKDGAVARGNRTDTKLEKYDTNGRKEWTRTLSTLNPGPFNKFGTSIDKDGSIFISGTTAGDLDGQKNGGFNDAFIAKYASDGTKKWTRLIGTSENDTNSSIATGSDGSVYLSGTTAGDLDGQKNNGERDAFITKYKSDGAKEWTRLVGTGKDDAGKSIATASDGSVYISGFTTGPLDGQANNGRRATFIVKYNSDGSKEWSRILQTDGYESVRSPGLATASDGSVYITGSTWGDLDGQKNSGMADAFLVKYKSDGTKEWTRLLGSSGEDSSDAIATASDGAIYISGLKAENEDGAIYKPYIAKFNSNGTNEWIQLAGEVDGLSLVDSIGASVDGSIYIKGVKYNNDSIQTGRQPQVYLGKYTDPTSAIPTRATASKTTTLASTIHELYLTGTGNINGTGNALNNYITGNAGNNILDGGAGNDFLVGGQGKDTYIVDSINDRIVENANEGIDLVKSSVNWTLSANLENLTLMGTANLAGTGNELNNVIAGNSGNNTLEGGAGNDTLDGGSGDDTLIGGLGNDVLKGGAGNDTYYVDSTGDIITESSGTDTVASSISWTLGVNLENLTLMGTDVVSGIGNNLQNTIIGNSGNNILDGLTGSDILTGGAGGDTFRFSTRPSFGASTADHITDFKASEGDVIQISKSAFGLASNATASLTSVSSASALTTALGSTTTFVYDSSNGNLYWNQNGNKSGFGSGGIFAVLDNGSALSTSNISLV